MQLAVTGERSRLKLHVRFRVDRSGGDAHAAGTWDTAGLLPRGCTWLHPFVSLYNREAEFELLAASVGEGPLQPQRAMADEVEGASGTRHEPGRLSSAGEGH